MAHEDEILAPRATLNYHLMPTNLVGNSCCLAALIAKILGSADKGKNVKMIGYEIDARLYFSSEAWAFQFLLAKAALSLIACTYFETPKIIPSLSKSSLFPP